MYDCDIVYIKGNPNSGSKEQHKQINQSIVEIIEEYKYLIIDSNENNKTFIEKIPKAKVYIGFSRGSRYLKKLSKDSLKISIGGISGSNIYTFTHNCDNVIKGDMSQSSMDGHFNILTQDKNNIKLLIENISFLRYNKPYKMLKSAIYTLSE